MYSLSILKDVHIFIFYNTLHLSQWYVCLIFA